MRIMKNWLGGLMTEKRFERIYEDVDVFCRDHNAKGVSQLIEREDYDKIVDLLNEQHETILSLHKTIKELDNCQKGQSHRINDLYLENKQLKDLIIHLGYTIKYDGYRHISLELQE